jgi:hypothetical protein
MEVTGNGKAGAWCRRVDDLACSPKLVPDDMRVFNGPSGRGDSHEGKEAHAGSDHCQAA